MRVLTEIVGGVALLAIFAYGIAYIIDILKHMEVKNGKNESPRMGTDSNDGADGDKPR